MHNNLHTLYSISRLICEKRNIYFMKIITSQANQFVSHLMYALQTSSFDMFAFN